MLKQRVAELEQQVRALENPRVTDEDWRKMALMYKERVAELEQTCNQLDRENAELRELHDNDMQRIADAEADTKRYQDLSNKYCLEVERRVAAAKIEGLKMAAKMAVKSEGDLDFLFHLINTEIAALEK
jgi:hypothetical protein